MWRSEIDAVCPTKPDCGRYWAIILDHKSRLRPRLDTGDLLVTGCEREENRCRESAELSARTLHLNVFV